MSSTPSTNERLDYVLDQADSVLEEASTDSGLDNLDTLILDYNNLLSQMRLIYSAPELNESENVEVARRLDRKLGQHHREM